MSDYEATNTKPDPNAGELDPPATQEEIALGRLMLEYFRHQQTAYQVERAVINLVRSGEVEQ